jgi:polyferredoxin
LNVSTTVTAGLKRFIRGRWFRYATIATMTLLLLAPFALIPQLFEQSDLCGGLCMRRFFLLYPAMGWDDLSRQIEVAALGVAALATILTVTFFFGRLWCGYLCPMGGLPELVSRLFHDRWKIDYRSLPQVPIRYGYFLTYILLLPALGFSACTLCNFITLPRLFEALSGDLRGVAYLISTIGAVNLGLLILLGFFAKLGRGYCQFLCPIGAIDALVNRIGAKLPFVRRIRVERTRCTGCRECAEACVCGAIRMVDRIAVVDQLSCMSCRECVVACEWGAIDWIHMPAHTVPKRLKKGVEVVPPPVWTAVTTPQRDVAKPRRIWRWAFVVMLLGSFLFWLNLHELQAGERQSDPDGCMVCHAAKGLAYVDERGVVRNATIDSDHYFSSLHGNVPCTDCHRKIREYPHKPENGEVDCAASCHVEEPSQGVAYSHEPIVKEFEKSVHGKGAVKGLAAANRWQESRNDKPPSCRRCHTNTLYIPSHKMERFREVFEHEEAVCGSCHQGEVWQGQMSGHILRRFLGARWSKQEEVAMCNDCHRDREAMAEVEREAAPDGTAKPSDAHFVYASDSYEMTLHARLMRENDEHGVSCNQCHAPSGFHHGILSEEDPESAVNPASLVELCGSSGCHDYVNSPLNRGFLMSEMHDLDWAPEYVVQLVDVQATEVTAWQGAFIVVAPLALVFAFAGLLWTAVKGREPKALPLLGGRRFDRAFLARKPKVNKANTKTCQGVVDEMIDRGRKCKWANRFWRKRYRKSQND